VGTQLRKPLERRQRAEARDCPAVVIDRGAEHTNESDHGSVQP